MRSGGEDLTGVRFLRGLRGWFALRVFGLSAVLLEPLHRKRRAGAARDGVFAERRPAARNECPTERALPLRHASPRACCFSASTSVRAACPTIRARGRRATPSETRARS